MYIQQEKQNRQINWMPAFAGMTANINLKKLSNDQLLF